MRSGKTHLLDLVALDVRTRPPHERRLGRRGLPHPRGCAAADARVRRGRQLHRRAQRTRLPDRRPERRLRARRRRRPCRGHTAARARSSTTGSSGRSASGIGKLLPATTLDRCIPIRLERRSARERIEVGARSGAGAGDRVRELLAGWAAAAGDDCRGAATTVIFTFLGRDKRAGRGRLGATARRRRGGRRRVARPGRGRPRSPSPPADDDTSDLAVVLLADIRRVFAEEDATRRR